MCVNKNSSSFAFVVFCMIFSILAFVQALGGVFSEFQYEFLGVETSDRSSYTLKHRENSTQSLETMG